MLSDDCVEGGNIQCGCNDDCQQQATVEPRKSTSFSGLSILKNRNGGSSKGITKDYSRRNSRRDESKSNMNTRTGLQHFRIQYFYLNSPKLVHGTIGFGGRPLQR